MQIIESLKQLYDKYSEFCISNSSEWNIIETAQNAHLKKLHFKTEKSVLGLIKNPFYSNLSSITIDRSNFLRDSNCDGVIIHDDGLTKKMIFVDLKSSLSSSNLKKAIKQDFYSFLKLQMLLSVCKDYDLNDYEIYFYMACCSCSEDELDYIRDEIFQHEESGDMDYSNYCLRSLLFNGNNWSCTLNQLPFASENLRIDILLKKINFRILTTKNPEDTELSCDL